MLIISHYINLEKVYIFSMYKYDYDSVNIFTGMHYSRHIECTCEE